jgi:hypothetical protein
MFQKFSWRFKHNLIDMESVMGELSKNIGEHGEHGERVVRNFLEVIGWSGAQEGESLICHDSEHHQRKKDTNRQTHGIDLFIHPSHICKTSL